MQTVKTFFDKISAHYNNDLPFVIYSKPNESRVKAFLQEDNKLYLTNDFSESGFVFSPFIGSENVVILEDKSEVFEVDWEFTLTENAAEIATTDEDFLKFEFENLVAKGIAAIKNGIFEKVVLSRFESVSKVDFDFIAVFQRLLNSYPTAFRYCWFHPKVGFWMGASPEQLLRLTDDTLSTMALAGTQLYQSSESVVWEDKEKQEQRIVTDYIVTNLKLHSSEIVLSNPYTSKAGNLLHIQTDIDAILKPDANLRDIIQALHPTPAVCGFPREIAKRFILDNEGYDRTFYSGFLGELNLKSGKGKATSLFVNLRCLQIKSDVVHLYMGCGITKDSIPENEYQETVNKSATMKRVLS